MYKIILRKQAEKQLIRIPQPHRRRIQNGIESLKENPLRGKPMEGEFKGCYSLPIKPYRIIYVIEKKAVTIHIFKIRHRQGAYK